MKKKIMIGICVLVFTILFLLWFIFLKPVHIDVTENLKLSFVGENGSGSVQFVSNEIDYNGWNPFIKKWMDNVTYDYSKDDKLKNGETINVRVISSTDLPSNLIIEHQTKKFTVKGLKKEKNIEVNEGLYKGGTVQREVEVIDGVEIPTIWNLSDEEKQRYVNYIKCIEKQGAVPNIKDPHNWENVPDNSCEY